MRKCIKKRHSRAAEERSESLTWISPKCVKRFLYTNTESLPTNFTTPGKTRHSIDFEKYQSETRNLTYTPFQAIHMRTPPRWPSTIDTTYDLLVFAKNKQWPSFRLSAAVLNDNNRKAVFCLGLALQTDITSRNIRSRLHRCANKWLINIMPMTQFFS